MVQGKHQTPNNIQYPNFNNQTLFDYWLFEYWNLLGNWNLVIGAY